LARLVVSAEVTYIAVIGSLTALVIYWFGGPW
jgi:hypothetical protein